MNTRSKFFSLLFVGILVITSLIAVKPVFAQSTPKPSVSEFTVKFEGNMLVITIKNQPFTPSTIQDNNTPSETWTTSLCFDIKTKQHSSENWTDWFPVYDGYPTQNSSSTFTVLSYGWDGSQIETTSRVVNILNGTQVDFQVQAMNGYIHRVLNFKANGNSTSMGPYMFTGETSGWSNTQTITIPETSSSASPNPTPTPTVPEFPVLTIPILLVVMVFAGLLVYFKKRKR